MRLTPSFKCKLVEPLHYVMKAREEPKLDQSAGKPWAVQEFEIPRWEMKPSELLCKHMGWAMLLPFEGPRAELVIQNLSKFDGKLWHHGHGARRMWFGMKSRMQPCWYKVVQPQTLTHQCSFALLFTTARPAALLNRSIGFPSCRAIIVKINTYLASPYNIAWGWGSAVGKHLLQPWNRRQCKLTHWRVFKANTKGFY